MAKKYAQTKKDRYDESVGMKRYEREKHSKGEMDSQFLGMISEDHAAPANLPQHVVHKYYPKCGYMDAFELDDTIRGLDDARRDDVFLMEKFASKDKY